LVPQKRGNQPAAGHLLSWHDAKSHHQPNTERQRIFPHPVEAGARVGPRKCLAQGGHIEISHLIPHRNTQRNVCRHFAHCSKFALPQLCRSAHLCGNFIGKTLNRQAI
ncbi:hypothetical protein T4E_3487, partial [Trichinella pseudospiralis]